MNLHEDRDTFAAAIQLASRPEEEGGLGIKGIFIEKDYWICRSLKMLSQSEVSEDAVFKGGTSLSKAYSLGGRFSEDIDVAVANDDIRTDNQTKKIVHSISKIMSNGLTEVLKAETRKFSKYRKVFYEYPVISNPVNQPSAVTPGQILLEIVSFANPCPFHKMAIKSFVAQYLEKTGREDLIERFDLGAFTINILDKRRTAAEKIVSLMRFSLADDYITELKAKIRHFYDLHFLWGDNEIREYLNSPQFKTEFSSLISGDQSRFHEPVGWQGKQIQESPLLNDFDLIWDDLKETYVKELPDLAYRQIPPPEEIAESFSQIIKQLKQ